MRPIRSLLPLVLLALLALATSGCSVNPVTGQREIMLMSESQAKQLGAQSDEAIVAQYGVVDDPQLAGYVERLGESMVPVSHRPDLDFTFRVLDDPVVNAFALPGGYVYITRGILVYLNSEAALAGVVGHEIGHVTARHSAQRYTQQTLMQVGLGVGSIVSEKFAQYANLAGTAGQLLLLKYGRDDERQSDRLGVEYATALGYDTHDMAEFFRTLDRLSPADGRLPSWMSTHPDPGERTETVHELTRTEQQAATGPFRDERGEFLRAIDGLVFGPDPRQGYVEGGTFHHPQLAFRFPVPNGWQLQNGRSQVVMMAPDEGAVVIFTGAPAETPSAAADAFLGQEGLEPVDRQNVTVAGANAVRTRVRMATEQEGSQMVVSTFFVHGGQSWVFHGVAAENDFRARQSTLLLPAEGFAKETDPGVLATEPFVLRVVESPLDGRFADAVAGWSPPEGAGLSGVEDLAVLNGMEATSPVRRGDRLKVVVRR